MLHTIWHDLMTRPAATIGYFVIEAFALSLVLFLINLLLMAAAALVGKRKKH